MKFAGLVKSSLTDYPGLVSCVLFAPGCNLDCFYCHNRALVEGRLLLLEQKELTAFLRKRVGQLDGVVITGGEPTLQPGLAETAEWLKHLGYKVKLDTNGQNPNAVKQLLEQGLCDYCAVDYKAPAARYAEICGKNASGKAALETIRLLANGKTPFEVRTTVIPQLALCDLEQMARELPVLPRYVLNRYRVPDEYPEAEQARILQPPHTREQITAFADALRVVQPNITA